ncbi:DUF4148 domain-containing protein [Paraburkholderia xenovorans]|uniref:DUF4148 domain-containing protein n=1 Tax=Paraburkholderia xenovorans TaxID=36873 RepID=UPI0038BA5BB6
MKSLLGAVVLAATVAFPAVSYSQTQQQSPVTRAEVRSELAQVRAAGYDSADWVHYPQNIQAAEARIAAEKSNMGYGPAANGTSQSSQ